MRIFDLAALPYDWITWQSTWRAHSASMVEHFGPLPARPQILDLGVGPGISALGILDALPQAQVIGLDLARQMLRRARRRVHLKVPLVQADAIRLPFADDSFDVVCGHSFLYLVPDRAAVVAEIARVLRPGRRCAFLEPHADAPRWALVRQRGALRFQISMALWRLFSARFGRFDRKGLCALLGAAMEQPTAQPTLGGLGLIGGAVKPAR